MLAAYGEDGVHSVRGKVDAWPAELHLSRKHVAFLKKCFLLRVCHVFRKKKKGRK
jgi:hypothetical protein